MCNLVTLSRTHTSKCHILFEWALVKNINPTKDQTLNNHCISLQGVYLKPFGMAMALMFLQQFSGINAVIFYLQNIFNAAGTEINPPGMSAFIVCIVQVLNYRINSRISRVILDKIWMNFYQFDLYAGQLSCYSKCVYTLYRCFMMLHIVRKSI
jgi:hypothetical protein